MLNWTNVRLVFLREVRDQLRDRRTLFMIFVLPILLYPLLGMSLFQVAQFVREQSTRVLVIGAHGLPDSPALLAGKEFDGQWFSDPAKSYLLQLEFASTEPERRDVQDEEVPQYAREVLDAGQYEAVLYFPPDFAARLQQFRGALEEIARTGSAPTERLEIPSPQIFHSAAKDKSRLTYERVWLVLSRWREEIGRQNLASTHLPERAAEPFALDVHDVSDVQTRDALMWSKLFPALLLFWALTGAFYPAIDLCAGEKERGTLETLLSSPAERQDIVWGKLLTVMLFSATTVVFNVLSMGVTGVLLLEQIPTIGPPPLSALLWVGLALVPVSAMFGALCLALAAFARSSKEGQYYLMPLVLVTTPLVVLPLSPSVELNLGNSLLPVTGIVLLLRTLIEGDTLRALPYVLPVVAVTGICCLLAIRWAVDQFNTESVLFREGERWGLRLWLRHLFRDREETPNVAGAVSCGVLILIVHFFMSFAMPVPTDFAQFIRLVLTTQLVVIATPALLMTVMLTRRPDKTLLLHWPALATVPAAICLAVALHPAATALRHVVMALYPVSPDVAESLSRLSAFFEQTEHRWLLLATIALVPAICEELAFRGFILSGARHTGSKWRAIFLASFFFGLAHPIFQQSVITCLIGVVLGYIAVQTGSLLPGICFHATHNALALMPTWIGPEQMAKYPILDWMYAEHSQETYLYSTPVVAAGLFLALVLLYWLHRLPYRRTPEEARQEAIARQSWQSLAG
jgi:sodium transport system permease protein